MKSDIERKWKSDSIISYEFPKNQNLSRQKVCLKEK